MQHFRASLGEKSCCLRVGDFHRSLELRTCIVAGWREKVATVFDCQYAAARARLGQAGNLLRVLGPTGTLARGYSITTNAAGEVVRSAAEVAAGHRLITRLSDGEVRSTVDAEPEAARAHTSG